MSTLITQYGFDADVSGWIAKSTAVAWTVITGHTANGALTQNLGGVFGEGCMSPAAAPPASKQIAVTAWVRLPPGGGAAVVSIREYSTLAADEAAFLRETASAALAGTSVFAKQTVAATVGGDCVKYRASVHISDDSGAGVLNVDDVVVADGLVPLDFSTAVRLIRPTPDAVKLGTVDVSKIFVGNFQVWG